MQQLLSRRRFLSLLAALPLAGCSPGEIQRGLRAADRILAGDVAGAVGTQIPTSGVAVVDQLLQRQLANLVTEIRRRWDDEKVASETEYVKYSDEFATRALVDFASGEIRVETRRRNEPQAALKQAIVATLLTPEDPSKVDLLSADEVEGDGQPFLYRLVADHDGEYIRWRWRAERYAEHLLATALASDQVDGEPVHYVTFAMLREYREKQQLKFQNYVLTNSRRFKQEPALVYAIMEAESSFNPYAMSHVPAYGLMQIVPTTAGRDAHRLLYDRDGTPSRDYLFVPENNIRMGTAYLHILDSRYLKMVENPASREYCVIAAYNTGSGNVLKAFAEDRQQAIRAINHNSPQQNYNHLVRHLPYRETRRYLPKVVDLKKKYQLALA
ncbi:MAG: murein transglycosylase domain-containing protein [Desulfurivibrio sp.]|nr:murein transglycosylase domain-containing protein [Desulfurivibrio sp.]